MRIDRADRKTYSRMAWIVDVMEYVDHVTGDYHGRKFNLQTLNHA